MRTAPNRPAKTTLRRALPVAAIVLVLAAACSPPRVNVKDAALTSLNLQGLAARIDLGIFNPNTYSVPLKSVEWRLDLFNAAFSQGLVPFTRQIAANQNADVRVPISVQLRNAAIGVQKLLSGQIIPWGVMGKCNFNTPAGPIFVEFNKKGRWNNPIRGGLKIPGFSSLHPANTPADPIVADLTPDGEGAVLVALPSM